MGQLTTEWINQQQIEYELVVLFYTCVIYRIMEFELQMSDKYYILTRAIRLATRE